MAREAEIYKNARAQFEYMIGVDPTSLTPIQQLQLRLSKWANTSLKGKHDSTTDTLGIGEELGEMCGPLALLMVAMAGKVDHAMLKNMQGIREHESKDPEVLRTAVMDGLSDMFIYAIQLCTAMRLCFDTILTQTAEIVMKRDWVADPSGASH